MEEILASIRRIISDEGKPGDAPPEEAARPPAAEAVPAGALPVAPAPAPAPVAAVEPVEEEPAEEVLVLTEVVEEIPSPPEQKTPAPVQAEPMPMAPPPDLPEPPPAPARDVPPAAKRAATDREAEDVLNPIELVSETTASASVTALTELTRSILRSRELSLGGGRTLEDLVREAMVPMLKEWLDENLASVVERLVRQEIERVVRRAEDSF
jgi:hypothetical protein